MDIFAAATLLFLVMDPLGNIPLFLSVLKQVPEERRRLVLRRELLIAYLVLLIFLVLGPYILSFLQVSQEAIRIGGGIVLFLIRENPHGEKRRVRNAGWPPRRRFGPRRTFQFASVVLRRLRSHV